MAALWKKAAKLQLGKDKWLDGELTVLNDRISFTGSQNTQIMMANITAFQKAKGTPVIRVCSSSGTEIFQLDSLDARVAFFAVVNPVWRGAAHATSTNLVSYIPKPGIQKAVFEANADLKNLYERFVKAGHITEAEFWASKKHAVKAIHAKSGGGQKAGLSTQLLSLLTAPKDTTSGRPQLSITPTMEQQIFAENPAVAAVYAKTVPHVRTREKFYEQYVDMLRNRVERRRKRAAGILTDTDKLLTDFEEEVARCESDLRVQRRNKTAQRMATADPTVNIAADSNDQVATGYGTCHAPGRENENVSTAGATATDLATELNTHAATVLDGWLGSGGAGGASGGSRPASGTTPSGTESAPSEAIRNRAQSGLEDLRRREGPQYQPLEIQDPKKYFMRRAAAAASADAVKPEPLSHGGNDMEPMQVDGEDDGSFGGGTQRVKRRLATMIEAGIELENPWPGLMHAKDALQALQDMREDMLLDGELGEGGRRLNPISVLPAAIVAGLKQQVVGVNELLRHFWMCFPVNTTGRADKVRRVASALDGIYQHSEAMRKSAAPEHRQYVAQLLRASTSAMDTALERFDREVKDKA